MWIICALLKRVEIVYQYKVNLKRQNVPAFENVANIDKLPPKGAYIIALPMKIKDGSGAPLRIVAIIPNN